MAEQKKYNEIRDNLNTGDIVLFSGSSAFSLLIKGYTRSAWSHVGMVMRIPDFDMVLLWEATTLADILDIDTGTATKGVQLVPLSQRMKTYKGDVSIRQLDCDRQNLDMEGLKAFRQDVKGKAYEKSEGELFKAAYDGWFGENVEDFSSVFCSELVAGAYQSMGLLEDGQPANEYTPKDFSSDGQLALKQQATLKPEIAVSL